MPRTSGGKAAGLVAMEERDQKNIKKHERQGNDVSIPKVVLAPLGQFPDPPVKRLTPWTEQNASGTDIIVGAVNESGTFQGIMLSEVQASTLLKFFQMAMAYMPRDTPGPVENMAKQMQNGQATVVVIRGTWGREADEGSGPDVNLAAAHIKEQVHEARLMNPNLKITCVDVPKNITGMQLSKVLEDPLSQYRELVFYDGTWYIPQVVHTPQIAQQLKERKRGPLWHTRLAAKDESRPHSVAFNRKAFPWRQDPDQKMSYVHTLKPVFTDPDYVQQAPPVIKLDFTGPIYSEKQAAIGEGEGQE